MNGIYSWHGGLGSTIRITGLVYLALTLMGGITRGRSLSATGLMAGGEGRAYADIYVYVFVHRMYLFVYVSTVTVDLYIHTSTYLYICIFISLPLYIHVCVYVYVYVYVYSYISRTSIKQNPLVSHQERERETHTYIHICTTGSWVRAMKGRGASKTFVRFRDLSTPTLVDLRAVSWLSRGYISWRRFGIEAVLNFDTNTHATTTTTLLLAHGILWR